MRARLSDSGTLVLMASPIEAEKAWRIRALAAIASVALFDRFELAAMTMKHASL
jgi:hypothetical protein